MNQSAYIAESVVTLFRANTDLAALIPGGLLYGIGKVPTAAPYGLMSVKFHGDPTFQSSPTYLQTYMLSINVWSNSNLANAGEIQTALESLLELNTPLESLVSGANSLANIPVPHALEEEPQRAGSQNVFIAGASWRIQIREVRPTT